MPTVPRHGVGRTAIAKTGTAPPATSVRTESKLAGPLAGQRRKAVTECPAARSSAASVTPAVRFELLGVGHERHLPGRAAERVERPGAVLEQHDGARGDVTRDLPVRGAADVPAHAVERHGAPLEQTEPLLEGQHAAGPSGRAGPR